MDVPSMKESTVNLAFTIMRDFADGALLEESAIDAEMCIRDRLKNWAWKAPS